MKEFARNLRRDITTVRTIFNSIRRMSRSTEPTVKWWDEASEDVILRLINRLSNPNQEERREIKRILKEFEVESVLDAGCGPCTEYLSYRMNGPLKDVRYVGLDRSQRMIDVARKRFADISVVEGDVERLPFQDNSFDAVVVRHVLEHQPSGYQATVSEAVRVARKCVIIDFFHMPLPFNIDINDRDGYANNWYSRKGFEKFLGGLPIASFNAIRCSGTSDQWAAIYTLEKTRLV